MLHGSSVELGHDNSIDKKAKLGIKFFYVYLAIYVGFVLLGLFAQNVLGSKVIGSLNLAIVYGMGLIILAAVMGIIYNFLCTKYENEMNKEVKQ